MFYNNFAAQLMLILSKMVLEVRHSLQTFVRKYFLLYKVTRIRNRKED